MNLSNNKSALLAFSLFLLLLSCGKNNTPSPPKTETSHIKTDILGKWFRISSSDSVFKSDGSFYSYNLYTTDTSTSYSKACNYKDYKDNGTYIFPLCVAPAPKPESFTYYDFISDSSFSETDSDLFTGQRAGRPYDTVTVKEVTTSTLTLYTQFTKNITDSTGQLIRLTYHKTNVWVK